MGLLTFSDSLVNSETIANCYWRSIGVIIWHQPKQKHVSGKFPLEITSNTCITVSWWNYFWWKRSCNSWYGSLSHGLQGVFTYQVGFAGFLNHQQYVVFVSFRLCSSISPYDSRRMLKTCGSPMWQRRFRCLGVAYRKRGSGVVNGDVLCNVLLSVNVL